MFREIAADYGVTFDGNWTLNEIEYVIRAIQDVGQAFAEVLGSSAEAAFRAVYGERFTFGRCGQGSYADKSCSGLGWTLGANEIIFRGFYTQLQKSTRLVIHELGHAFDWAVCGITAGCENTWDAGSARSDLTGRMQTYFPTTLDGTCCLGREGHAGPGPDEYWGYAGDWDDWQFGRDTGNGEVWADMFLGWTYNQWGSRARGANRRNYMNPQMSIYLLSVAVFPTFGGVP